LSRVGYGGGMPREFMIYMLATLGQEVVDELQRRKNGWYLDDDGEQQRIERYTNEELIEIRRDFRNRTKASEKIIKAQPLGR